MNILVIGEEVNLKECRQKFGEQHHYQLTKNHFEAEKFLKPETIVFDFRINQQSDQISVYEKFSGIVFLDTCSNMLNRILNGMNLTAFGFCGLPSFLNREILEVSLSAKADQSRLEEACRKLNTKFALVKDQVGLVTARVICMIINEAYFTIQENIASRADIDLAMKLGTNYPFGPFEWCKKIGVENVYELLNAVYESTKDDRYKVCELLRKEAQSFHAKSLTR